MPGESRFAEGTRRLLQGDARGARESLSYAVDREPLRADARHNLAVALRLLGELGNAVEQARAVCSLDPTFVPGHTHLGVLFALGGHGGDARASYARALALDPRDRVACFYAGHEARLDGRLAEARALFLRAVAPGPDALPALTVARIEGMLAELPDDPSVFGLRGVRTACTTQVLSEVLTEGGGLHRAQLERTRASALDEEKRVAPAAREFREVTAREVAVRMHTAKRIVALTGAGMSAESGLATRKELWERFVRDEVVFVGHTRQRLDPLWRVVADFLGDGSAEPNAGHLVLARIPRLAAIVTQNVDHLHQRAAPASAPDACPIYELHGTLERTFCQECGARDPGPRASYRGSERSDPPWCKACRKWAMRPDVVLFGEWVQPAVLESALAAALSCDVLLVVGCSMDVSPASELPRLAAQRGATVIELKRSPSRISRSVGTWLLRGTAATALPAVYRALSELEPLEPLARGPKKGALSPALSRRRASVPTVMRMPKLGESIVEGHIYRWLVKPGDAVFEGQPVCEVDTDKVSVEIPAECDGVVGALLEPEDTVVPINAPIAEIVPREVRGGVAVSAPVRQIGGYFSAPKPLLREFGVHTPMVRALLKALLTAPWLTPDTQLQSGGFEGDGWVQERFDEHCAALDLREDEALALFVTRDRAEAAERATQAWGLTGGDRGTLRFDRAPSGAGERRVALLAAARARASVPQTAAYEALAEACRKNSRFGPLPYVRQPFPYMALPEAVARFVLDRQLAEPTPAQPRCAFRPLLELWLRGAWPFVLPEGLGVWIPREPKPPSVVWCSIVADAPVGELLVLLTPPVALEPAPA